MENWEGTAAEPGAVAGAKGSSWKMPRSPRMPDPELVASRCCLGHGEGSTCSIQKGPSPGATHAPRAGEGEAEKEGDKRLGTEGGKGLLPPSRFPLGLLEQPTASPLRRG